MSLLVFGSANRIAQGVIKRLHASGNYEKIICADLYPNYASVQRALDFQAQLSQTSSSTQLEDVKIFEKSDVKNVIGRSSHILYITHDYFSLVPSKINLIKTVAEVAKKSSNVEKLVALTPVEHDHYDEPTPALTARKSEEEAIEIFPELVHLKPDITFGEHSTVVSALTSRIINNLNITFQPRTFNEQTSPIYSEDLAKIVESALKNNKFKGKAYAVQGPDSITLGELLSIIQKHTGNAIKLNEDPIERAIPPYNPNLVSQRIYDPEYINLTAFLREYKTLEKSGLNEVKDFKFKLKGIESIYSPNGVDASLYKEQESPRVESLIKKFLYF